MNAEPDGVAIVGMAGRFPGAESVDALWRNLVEGRESIARFDARALSPQVPRALREHPRYVAARGIIADAARFDAAFFGIGAREALLIDPQQRVLLELCWNALEHAGLDPRRFAGSIGVYAGVSNNGYRRLLDARPDLVAASGEFAAMLANEKDYVATRIAHRIGLGGPAISVHTACSTSLVAVAQAWYALMSWQCDAALAGGINIVVPQESGYLPVDGGMESPDGHCRPFDARADGTVFSSGGGVVVLKRLADARRDGDFIWAVIRGVGVNNDGADKASFTAPSVRGQSAAIGLALASAGIDPAAIGYVEAHGTGTALGDPVEVEALARAFGGQVPAQSCWLGSLKSNVGHLVAGSGVAGLIKAVLALHHQRIPPTLHFRTANPEIDFAATPFKVADRAIDWPRGEQPRRAGVSSFGVGGTNAHVIVEEAPARPAAADPARSPVVLPLSARDEAALRRRCAELADALDGRRDGDLADAGWTLATGRRALPVRTAVVARSIEQARERLRGAAARSALDGARVVFLFPGQGSQHAGMARGLVACEPAFATVFAQCCEIASPLLGCDLRALILAEADAAAAATLARTCHAQPALFAVEYALARLWQSWGIEPVAMIGHSIGEYVAACLAGVFTLADALRLVVARAQAMDAQPRGAMLAVHGAQGDIAERLPHGAEIAAINAPDLVAVSGSETDIARCADELAAAGIASTQLRVSHAFHSALIDGALAPFRRAFDGVSLRAPALPFHSCVSGRPISVDEATSPDYWCRQIRAPVRFADAVADALDDAHRVALEVGPGQALSALLRRRPELRDRSVASLGPSARPGADDDHLAAAVARLWSLGINVDWDAWFDAAHRRRMPLPGYPFGGERYWIDASAATEVEARPPQDAAAAGANGTAAPDLHAAAASSASTAAAERAPAAAQSLRAALRDLVAGLGGAPLAPEHDGAGFIDLGLDSLALTQLALEIERRHGVRLKFRRLMEDIDTIERVAALIEREAPDVREAAGPPAPATRRDETPAPPVEAPAAFGAAARITTHAQAALDPGQERWLRDFVARYARRTARSKAFSQEQRSGMADPRVVTGFHPLWKELVYPIVVARSHGACLEDIDGNTYIDLLNAFGANFLGYQPECITRALREQIDSGFEIGPQHPLTAEVAALIREMTGVERVAFCNTGSEAVMGAMRIARTATGRRTIVIFRDSYHGIFDEVIVRGTPQLRSIAAAPGILASAVENVLVLDYGAEASLEVIRERAPDLAAVMIEPVQARNPELRPRAFVQQLRAICDAAGCALIFDEVITGFRIAPGGAQEFFGVRADIVTYGKIIGGGLPLAVIAGAARWLDALDGGPWRFGDDSRPEAGVTYFAGTFVRHPLALAAAKAALSHLREQGGQLQRDLNARTQALVDRLNAFFAAQSAPLRALGFSSLWRVRIDADQALAELFYYALRERGLHVYAQFNCFLSAAHGVAEVERIVEATEAATLELLDAGILHRRAALRLDEPRFGEPARESSAPQPFDPAVSAALPATLPLTDAQMEKWLACQFGDGASVAFNESQLLLLDGALERARLERAVATVSARHEAFAMSFAADGSAFRVGARAAIVPAWLDLSGARAAESLQAHCAAAVRRPFDLTRAPLARIDLIRLGPERHALLVVAHHLVFDGWSAAVFLDELAQCYRAGDVAGARLAPAQSFRAFALAQQHRRERTLRAQLDWWAARFADVPERIELPLDRARPLQPDFAANTVFHDFSAPLTAALRTFSRRHGVTVYGALLAGFGVLLARLTGQDDFAIGIPFASQAAAGSGALLGDGVNTLPLRVAVGAGESFADVARRCHRALIDAAEHQDVTLYTLLNALDPLRRAERSGLTDVIFNLNPRLPALDFGALRHAVRDCAKAALVKDLFFNLNDGGDVLTLDLHYRTALFDAATIVRWIGHYETLLRSACATPDVAVARLPLLDEAQRAALVDEANATARDLACNAGLVALVRAQAQRTPERIAVECANASCSYAQLTRRIDAIGALLAGAGVGAGDVVGVCVPRSIDLVAALLGVLACGAAYLPLDAGFPEPRLRFIVEDAGVRHLVVGSAGQLPAGVADGRVLHALDAPAADTAPVGELPPTRDDALAYVLYTSGSTGEPKGVRVRQRSLVNLLLAMREEPGLRADDVLCAVTTPTFDIAALELFLPLLCGARVLIASEAEHRDPDALVERLRTGAATVLQTTPSLLRRLAGERRLAALPRLKLLIGGEELPRDLAEAVLPHCAELWNLYGPTETTIWSTLERVTSGSGSVPIGRPIANTRVYVVDAHGQLAAPGVHGELWIGGAGVADGYLNRPDQTAQRFLADPFREDGARIYRSGDCVSWRNGRLLYHGRVDDQIKLRGFRIEPGDVEAAALADPRVHAAAAAVHALAPDDRRLVLHVVAPDAGAGFERQLRERLRRCLPPYMVPQHVERLDALPQTAHGKTDRAALPAPRDVQPRAGAAGIAAAAPPDAPADDDDALAQALLGVWRDLIGVPGLELDSNFFDVGGDSLLGVELFQRAHALTGVSLPLATLLTAQTVREQARAFRAAGARDPVGRRAAPSAVAAVATADPWSPLVAIRAEGDGPPLFCVHAIGGNVLNYAALARAIGTRQPVYGLQAIGLDGVTPPLLSIEHMAARYLAEVRKRFPHGPYWLCGGSMGGLIAYEMAQRLRAAGEEVAFVGLFDTYGPDDGAAGAGVLQRWRDRFARARGLDSGDRIGFVVEALRQRLRRAADVVLVRWYKLRGTTLPVALRYREIERVHLRADVAYRPHPYAGSVTLFRATGSGEAPTLGWDRYVTALRVIAIPASHDSLIEQPQLAVELRKVLAQTRAEHAAAATQRLSSVA